MRNRNNLSNSAKFTGMFFVYLIVFALVGISVTCYKSYATDIPLRELRIKANIRVKRSDALCQLLNPRPYLHRRLLRSRSSPRPRLPYLPLVPVIYDKLVNPGESIQAAINTLTGTATSRKIVMVKGGTWTINAKLNLKSYVRVLAYPGELRSSSPALVLDAQCGLVRT